MKALFTHDHYFLKDQEGTIYSTGKLPYSIWERYLIYFETLTIAARMQAIMGETKINNLNVSSGMNVSFVPIANLSSPIKMISNRKDSIDKIEKALQSVDILIARMPSEISALSIELAIKHGKPYVVEVVGCVWDAFWNYGGLQGKIYAPFASIRAKKLIRRAPFAIYVTSSFLQNRYPCDGLTTACSDVELNNLDEDSVVSRSLRHDKKPFRIGLIGSLNSKYKGIEAAIKAVKLISSKNIKCELKILGAGDSSIWCRLAKDNGVSHIVKFDGVLPFGDQVNSWLDDLDLYIQPSLTEGLPRALIEAMSRGCPAVGSNVGGIPELLDGQCLVTPNNYKQLSDKILWLINNPTIRTSYSKRNFEFAKSYTRAVLDSKRELFWKKVINTVKN